MHVRLNDLVAVMAGNEAGKTGKIIKVLRDKERVVIKGVNLVYRHTKPSQKKSARRENTKGGISFYIECAADLSK